MFLQIYGGHLKGLQVNDLLVYPMVTSWYPGIPVGLELSQTSQSLSIFNRKTWRTFYVAKKFRENAATWQWEGRVANILTSEWQLHMLTYFHVMLSEFQHAFPLDILTIRPVVQPPATRRGTFRRWSQRSWCVGVAHITAGVGRRLSSVWKLLGGRFERKGEGIHHFETIEINYVMVCRMFDVDGSQESVSRQQASLSNPLWWCSSS